MTVFGPAMTVAWRSPASLGQPLQGALFSPVVVTAHLSSVLRERERDRDARQAALRAIGEDLLIAAEIAAEIAADGRAHGGRRAQ